MAEDFSNMPTYCKICRTEIPEERARRRASTCSEQCLATSKKIARHRHDNKFCRICQRPATREERALYNRWRKFQASAGTLGHLMETLLSEQGAELRRVLKAEGIVLSDRDATGLKAFLGLQAQGPFGRPKKVSAPDDDHGEEQERHAEEGTPVEAVQ